MSGMPPNQGPQRMQVYIELDLFVFFSVTLTQLLLQNTLVKYTEIIMKNELQNKQKRLHYIK